MSSKDTAAYWRDRVEKHRRAVRGRIVEDRDYSVCFMIAGRRGRIPLKTGLKEKAAQTAVEYYKAIQSRGWDQVLASIKVPRTPKAQPQPAANEPAQDGTPVTVGAVIEACLKLSTARAASKGVYARSLRTIVSGVFGIEGKCKHGPSAHQDSEWRAKVDAIPFADLTPARVLAWRNQYLESASLAQRDSAAVTMNSFLRNARALFSRKVLRFLKDEIELPPQLFFEGIEREKEPSSRYSSQIDAPALIRAAQKELEPADPEAFKLILLALVFGLRRSEADKLLWSQFDFDRRVLRIQNTDEHRLKSPDSAGDVAMDPETCALFRGFHARAKDRRFVLDASPRTSRGAGDSRYRSDATHRRLMSWLRSKGVMDKKPIHALRKEIGSIVASRDGIFAASRYLRHGDIHTTSRYYADQKTPITAGLGSILSLSPENVVEANFASTQRETSPEHAKPTPAKRTKL